MVNETKKIMEDDSIQVTATTVRVPVFYSHSESVNVEFEKDLSPEQARKLLKKAPGVKVVDNPSKKLYPLAINAAGKDDTFVGRIRRDESVSRSQHVGGGGQHKKGRGPERSPDRRGTDQQILVAGLEIDRGNA